MILTTLLTCNDIFGISESEVRIGSTGSYKCYNESGLDVLEDSTWMNLPRYPSYTFSDEKNMFVSVGCNTMAFIQGRDSLHYTSGCVTMCETKESILNGSCSGIGCCHTSIPKGLTYFEAYIDKPDNLDSAPFNYSPCSCAFLVEYREFQFHASSIFAADIYDYSFYDTIWDMPVVLDWVVENITCEDARHKSGFACLENTVCFDSDNGPGYRCSCKQGYKGNPYLTPGCQDINECEEDPSKHQCLDKGNCINLLGTYNCTCLPGTHGDGRKDSIGCVPDSKQSKGVLFIEISFGVVLFVVISSCWLYLDQKRRRVARLKEKFFKQNGGLLLQQHEISSHEGGSVKLTRIYTTEELKKATNNYDENRILGRGGNGTVYKGTFPHEQAETVVAIKKSKIVNETQIEQFINEVVILTQINHRHVVRLLGCCLETEVPLLVYEFISNGTLHEHIHNRPLARITLQHRLRIAAETASALAYLHSAASTPIIHRDVKSSNILLDDNYSTKVADFGASRLIPLDQTQISTLVQGTLGYLDPEYFQTSQLTEKSDVYSFGVVLVELLTGEKPFSNDRSDDRKMLASHFILSMRDNALLQVIEKQLVGEDNEEQLFAVAELALRCLNFKGEERPTMRDVAIELEGLRRLFEQHPWDEEKGEEARYLLAKSPDLYPIHLDPSIGDSTGQYSMNTMMSPLNLPR